MSQQTLPKTENPTFLSSVIRSVIWFLAVSKFDWAFDSFFSKFLLSASSWWLATSRLSLAFSTSDIWTFSLSTYRITRVRIALNMKTFQNSTKSTVIRQVLSRFDYTMIKCNGSFYRPILKRFHINMFNGQKKLV